MSENKDAPKSSPIVSVALPGNSRLDKVPAKVTPPDKDREPIKQVAVGVPKKPGFFKKLGTTFTGEDAKSVGDYLFFDVMVPAVKNTLWEMLSQGSERMLFGSSSTRPPASRERGGHIPYGRMSTSTPRATDRGSERRELSRQDRATHNFDAITVASREEAEMVLNSLGELVEDYGVVRVADFYEMLGISGNYIDGEWGWYSMADTGCKPYRGQWLIVMPKPERIE